MHEEYALQTILPGGSVELLFSRMSICTLWTDEKKKKKKQENCIGNIKRNEV